MMNYAQEAPAQFFDLRPFQENIVTLYFEIQSLIQNDPRELCVGSFAYGKLLEIGEILARLTRIIVHDQAHSDRLDRYNSLLELFESGSHDVNPATTPPTFIFDPDNDDIVATLDLLLRANFKRYQIANILGMSIRTLYRLIEKLRPQLKYGQRLGDAELLPIVQSLSEESGFTMGGRIIHGGIAAMGYHVDLNRVKKALALVDPVGVVVRLNHQIKRRVYKVPGPNALWHLDGNHHLIRWKFVLHGCIDGFSRYVTFMNVSTNNRSSTVVDVFRQAVKECGLPSRVRGDYGVENVLVCDYMEFCRGFGRGSYIAGRSVHNQRIERLWVDVGYNFTTSFYNLFILMESNGILNHESDLDLAVLHYVYLQPIRNAAAAFTNFWNNHKISTVNKSPFQMFFPALQRGFEPEHDFAFAAFLGVHIEELRSDQLRNSDNNVIVDVQGLHPAELILIKERFGIIDYLDKDMNVWIYQNVREYAEFVRSVLVN